MPTINRVVTAAQMRQLETAAVAAGATWRGLMTTAGEGVAALALQLLGEQRGPVLVLVGPGNNGGDALVAALALQRAGVAVQLYEWRRAPSVEDWPWQAAMAAVLPVLLATGDPEHTKLRRWLGQAALIIDGWLGSGVNRTLPADLIELITVINAERRGPLLAIDLPTGIDADTGQAHGAALRADVTAATGLCKRGLLASAGRQAAGRLTTIPLALPSPQLEHIMTTQLSAEQLRSLLPARPADANKGTFGKLMITAGSARYPGAAFLAATGALRSGVGLVTLAVGRSLWSMLAASLHEPTFLPLPEADWGVLGQEAAVELRENLAGYAALVVGPGLGREDDTKTFLRRLLKIETAASAPVGFVRAAGAKHERTGSGLGVMRPPSSDKPVKAKPDDDALHLPALVLDADALNLLSELDEWATHLAPGSAVLTPHPGELARLLKLDDAAAVNADRIGHAERAAQQWGQVVVLKGANTVIAAPDGQTAIGPDGNAALAKAGTGDVLSGLIGGLLAQGLTPWDAARVGVWLHADAGLRVRAELGAAGAAAGDLGRHLALALRDLGEDR